MLLLLLIDYVLFALSLIFYWKSTGRKTLVVLFFLALLSAHMVAIIHVAEKAFL